MALLSAAGCSGMKQSTAGFLTPFALNKRKMTIPYEDQMVAPSVQQIDNQYNPR